MPSESDIPMFYHSKNMYDKPFTVTTAVKYYLSEHPIISGFTWSPTQLWGSTWSFLVCAITLYVAAAATLHLLLRLVRRSRGFALGPIPALHSLAMCAVYSAIFAGTLVSAAAEIRDTRWLWRRRTTPLQWLLCFPLGTRPSGRVFFWSYAFYLSRLLGLPRTFFKILRHRRLSGSHLLNQSFLIVSSFLWLEFSQSFQVLAVLFTALVHAAANACRFWAELGALLPGARARAWHEWRESFVVNCRVVLLGFNLVCHLGVLLLHFLKGGCNGIGAWVCNSVLNAVILLLFFKYFYVKEHLKKKTNQLLAAEFDKEDKHG